MAWEMHSANRRPYTSMGHCIAIIKSHPNLVQDFLHDLCAITLSLGRVDTTVNVNDADSIVSTAQEREALVSVIYHVLTQDNKQPNVGIVMAAIFQQTELRYK
jgi:hypothetical protein